MESNTVLRTGTISGTLLCILPGIFYEDILKTALLAVIGATVSFCMTLLLKWVVRRKIK